MDQTNNNVMTCSTLAQLCLCASAKYKNKTAFSLFSDGVISRKVTYTQMGSRARKIALALKRMGVEKGDRVMLLSDNCPEWSLAYFGIALAGAVSVPVLTGFSAEQIQYIADHAGIRAICLSKSSEQMMNLPEFSKIPGLFIDNMTEEEACNGQDEISVESNPEELATIIYTSGTQGLSKGVMLSSKNIISSALSSLTFVKIYPRDRFLSVLPLAHSYECGLGFIAPVFCGASITYIDRPPSPSVLLPALKFLRPTAMLSVPLLIEKIYYNAISPKLLGNKLYKFPLSRPLAIWAAGRKLISAFGGRIRFFGIGGAPLSPEVENFLYKAKFPYSIGYGLTETAPLVAGNAPFRFKLGSGISAPNGVKLRIDKTVTHADSDEGEIQVQGPNVMLGYYKDEEKTSEIFTSDGWLRTGDLGSMDNDRLYIRGRLKALILGPSGENIYPEEIEKILGSSQLVEESLVYSGKMGELIALVRLSEAAKSAAGVLEHTLEDLRKWVNKKLAVFSKLSRIEIKYEPFEKTPTMKIKRYLYVGNLKNSF